MNRLLAGIFLLTLGASTTASADEFWGRHRAQRRALLMHESTPLRPAVEGRARPDTTGSFDLQQVKLQMRYGEGILADTAIFEIEITTGDAAVRALPLVAALFSPLQVNWGARALDFIHEPDTGELLILFPGSVPPNTTLRITMDVEFTFDCNGDAACTREGLFRHLVTFGWYPMSGEFPLEDRFIFSAELTGRAMGMIPTATGRRTGVEPSGNDMVWAYETELPTNLPMLALGEYTLQSHDEGVEVFVPRRTIDEGRALSATATRTLALYAELFGPYPFSRLGITPISDRAGVGLGPQANILLPGGFWGISEDDERFSVVRDILSHEIAHQYFYNLLGVVDDTESWMSEGFAEYGAIRLSESVTGTDDHSRLNYWTYVLNTAADEDVAITDEALNWAPAGVRINIVYNKSSVIIEQLRKRLPDFDRLMRDYVTQFRGQIVSTLDFQQFLVEQSGLPLNGFFQRWVHRAGFPIVQVEVHRPRDDDSDSLEITVSQAENPNGGFAARVELRGETGAGIPLSGAVNIAEASDQTVPLGQAHQIQFDPDLTIFRRIRPEPRQDINLSGVVDGMDLLDSIAAAGQGVSVPDPRWRDEPDINGDLSIDREDTVLVIEHFGAGW